MRVYLPATLPLLRQWTAAGEAQPAGPAYSVTPALREWYREGDLEELEHVAQLAAAAGSLRLLAADGTAPPRRAVIAAEIDDAVVHVTSDLHRAAVTLTGPVSIGSWGSALIDDAGAGPVVIAALAALAEADRGEEDARFVLDEAAAYELGWYAVQELPDLLGSE